MGRYTRGTEYEGIPELTAPGQVIPKKSPKGVAAGGGGTKIIIEPGPATRGNIQWNVVSAGVTHIEAAGAGITVNDLSTVNSSLQGLAYSFPGADADDNSWTVYWQTPLDWDNTKPTYVTIQAVPL